MDRKYGCLPVVDQDRLVGILTEADFVHYVAGLLDPDCVGNPKDC
jgi:CBS domain-containing membrane protein